MADCCNSVSLRVNVCGEEFLFADWDGDQIIDADFTPEIVSYSGVTPDPADAAIAPTLDANGDPSGVMPIAKYAVRDVDGCITHIAVCGAWICVTGHVVEEPVGFQTICFDTPATPLTTNTDTAGLTVGGVFYPFDIECPDETATVCPDRVRAYSGFDNPHGTPKPDIQLLTEIGDQALPDGCNYILTGVPNTNLRNTFRFEFPIWSTTGGQWLTQNTTLMELEFEILARTDNIGVGLYSPTGQVWGTVVSVTPPAGAVANFHYANYGDHVALITAATPPSFPIQGKWRITFSPQAGLAPSDQVDAIFWSINHSGPAQEDVRNIRFTVTADPIQPCYPIGSAAQIAGLANLTDPTAGVAWIVQDNQICAVVPDDQVGLYTGGQAALTL